MKNKIGYVLIGLCIIYLIMGISVYADIEIWDGYFGGQDYKLYNLPASHGDSITTSNWTADNCAGCDYSNTNPFSGTVSLATLVDSGDNGANPILTYNISEQRGYTITNGILIVNWYAYSEDTDPAVGILVSDDTGKWAGMQNRFAQCANNQLAYISSGTTFTCVNMGSDTRIYRHYQMNISPTGVVNYSVNGTIYGSADVGLTEITKVYIYNDEGAGVATYFDNITICDDNDCSILNLLTFENPTPPDGAGNITQVNINLSCDVNNVTLWFGNSSNLNNSHLKISQNNTPANWTTNVTAEDIYYYKASCNFGGSNSSLRTWRYDLSAPTITLNPTNGFTANNQTILTNNSLTFNITVEDNLDLYALKIDVNFSNGTRYISYLRDNLSGTSFNYNNASNLLAFPNGDYSVDIWASDSHTENSIKNYAVDTKNKEILFLTDKDNLIKISSNLDSSLSYTKKQDRYNFGFDFGKTLTQKKVFTIECDKKLSYRNTRYKGHFVCSNDGIDGNWIDFEGVSGTPIIKKITDYKYTVAFNNLENKVIFHSIGGLNVLKESYLFSMNAFSVDNCSTLTNSFLNLSYLDQVNSSEVNIQNAFDLTVIGLGISKQLNGTMTGTGNSFCTNIDKGLQTLNLNVSGQMTLTRSGYATKLYSIDAAFPIEGSNNPNTLLDIFLIPLANSTTVKFTWLTTAFQPVSGTMEIYQCLGDGTRTLVDTVPIIDSVGYANIELLNKAYSYEIIIDGERYTDSESFTECHIEAETEVTFNVDIGETELGDAIDIYSVRCDLNKTGNQTVRMNWTDTEGVTGCIFAHRYSIGGYTEFYGSCENTTNVIERTVPNSGFNYMITGRIYQGGLAVPCPGQVEFNFNKDTADSFGLMGILSIFLLIAAMVLFFKTTGEMQIVGGILGILVAWFLGILAFGWVVISSIIAFSVVIIIVGRYSRQPE